MWVVCGSLYFSALHFQFSQIFTFSVLNTSLMCVHHDEISIINIQSICWWLELKKENWKNEEKKNLGEKQNWDFPFFSLFSIVFNVSFPSSFISCWIYECACTIHHLISSYVWGGKWMKNFHSFPWAVIYDKRVNEWMLSRLHIPILPLFSCKLNNFLKGKNLKYLLEYNE